jgi:hypothetical protein
MTGPFTFGLRFIGRIFLLAALLQAFFFATWADDEITGAVREINGSIEILRFSTNGNLLHVSDMYEIKNESRPPRTLAGERTFEVYLPANAKIDSVLAAGPGGVPSMISAKPVPGEPGHYTLNFPLRPGATKFAFNYDLPYSGRAAFQTRRAYPMQQLALMIPSAMKFSSRSSVLSGSSGFETLPVGNKEFQVHSINRLAAGKGPEFEISGIGALPALEAPAKSNPHPQFAFTPKPATSASAQITLHSPARFDSALQRPQSFSQLLVLLALTGALVAVCVFLAWHAASNKPPRLLGKWPDASAHNIRH